MVTVSLTCASAWLLPTMHRRRSIPGMLILAVEDNLLGKMRMCEVAYNPRRHRQEVKYLVWHRHRILYLLVTYTSSPF